MRRRLLLLLLAVALVMAAAPAGAADLDELRQQKEQLQAEREELKEQRAQVASQVAVEQASAQEIRDALADIQADVDAKVARLETAQRAAGRARDQVTLAQQAVLRAEAERVDLQGELERVAVRAYIRPPNEPVLAAISSGNSMDGPMRKVLTEVTAGTRLDLLDEYRRIEEDLDVMRQRAEDAELVAEEREARIEEELVVVEAARDRQQAFADEVEDRIDHLLSEAASLEAIDADFAAELRSTESKIAAEIAEIQRRQAEEARRRAGTVNIPNLPSSGEIVNASGIAVHASIADNVRALLAAAAADGVNLGGGGYRSSASQIALRRAHCGTSDYAIYQAPSSSCRPPTARPGRSNHERGLAIDFTYGGRTICCRSNPGYQWLAANASRFGLYNLPSEPWHWSVNGQ